ncbi:MAG: peptide ABC transporter substrate-binding protein [Candidatus Uhrbacteria bacterium]|nr:peptide ABC transporter substrate-binding protein [Candidatus Uhrbacteria bacterium]
MSLQEKKMFLGSLSLIFVSLLFLAGVYVFAHRVELPAVGGDDTEALIGTPRLINPLYASTNDADEDLASLIYSGLLKWDPTQGYINDLADSMTVSNDQLSYTLRINPNAKFSDGEPVQARDVVFTYSALQDSDYRSPLSADFRDIKIEQADDQTVLFTLKNPDPSFSHKLTIGILPNNLWSDILAQNVPLASLNLQPIGSGPYAFQEFTKDKKGSIRTYTLKRNTHYYGTEPKIEKFIFKFYPDEQSATQALTNKNVEAVGYVAFEHRATIENNHGVNLLYSSIPRGTALYFNTQNALLKNTAVRLAIAQAIDKNKLVSQVLSSHASVMNGPIFNGTSAFDPTFAGIAFDPSAAASGLDTAGFQKPVGATLRQISNKPVAKKKGTDTPAQPGVDVSFTLTTISSDEFVHVAQEIKDELSLLGIGITIKTVDADNLMTDVVATQDYELLLTANYGATNPDPYFFWHSSQIGKGGFNISHYQNADADKLLEKARSAKTQADEDILSRQFQSLLVKEVPAVFLYQSTYAFAEPKKIHLNLPPSLRVPSDRFANVEDWYIKTKQTLK